MLTSVKGQRQTKCLRRDKRAFHQDGWRNIVAGRQLPAQKTKPLALAALDADVESGQHESAGRQENGRQPPKLGEATAITPLKLHNASRARARLVP